MSVREGASLLLCSRLATCQLSIEEVAAGKVLLARETSDVHYLELFLEHVVPF